MTNESALLGLLADLQKTIYALQAENASLVQELQRLHAEHANDD